MPLPPIGAFVQARNTVKGQLGQLQENVADDLVALLKRYERDDPVTGDKIFVASKMSDREVALRAFNGERWWIAVGPVVYIMRQGPRDQYPREIAWYDSIHIDREYSTVLRIARQNTSEAAESISDLVDAFILDIVQPYLLGF